MRVKLIVNTQTVEIPLPPTRLAPAQSDRQWDATNASMPLASRVQRLMGYVPVRVELRWLPLLRPQEQEEEVVAGEEVAAKEGAGH